MIFALDIVCNEHSVSKEDLRSHSRKPHLVRARWDAMKLLRARGLSLPAIGRLLNRHHTTVLDGLRRAG